MMKYLAVVLALVGGSQAFNPTPYFSVGRRNIALSLYVPYYNQNNLERAVACSEEYGLCDVDELMKLADGKYDWFQKNDNIFSLVSLMLFY